MASNLRMHLTPIQKYNITKVLMDNKDRVHELTSDELIHLIEGETQLALSKNFLRTYLKGLGLAWKRESPGKGMQKLKGLVGIVEGMKKELQSMREDLAVTKSKLFAIEMELGITTSMKTAEPPKVDSTK